MCGGDLKNGRSPAALTMSGSTGASGRSTGLTEIDFKMAKSV
jgi:hypothetical protein